MAVNYFLARTPTIWDFTAFEFFLEKTDEFTGIDHEMKIHGGVIFGEPIFLVQEYEAPGAIAFPGELWVRFSSKMDNNEHLGKVMASFGLDIDIVHQDMIESKFFSGSTETEMREFRNAARVSKANIYDYLGGADEILAGIQSREIVPHVNAPSLNVDTREIAPFYDPRGPQIVTSFGAVSIHHLQMQAKILENSLPQIFNPYERGSMVGLISMIEALAEAGMNSIASNQDGESDS